MPSHKDAETLMVDPDTGDMYIVTKRITPARCYRLAHQASYSGTQTLEYLGEIWTGPFTDDATGPSTGGYVVGGSISDDGKLIVLKNYQDVFVFVREDKGATSIYDAMTATPLVVEGYVGGERPSSHPNNEPKGEGVCFLANGDLVTTSEYNATYGSSASAYPTFRYARLADVPAQVAFQDGFDGYAGTADTYIWSLSAEQGNAKGSEDDVRRRLQQRHGRTVRLAQVRSVEHSVERHDRRLRPVPVHRHRRPVLRASQDVSGVERGEHLHVAGRPAGVRRRGCRQRGRRSPRQLRHDHRRRADQGSGRHDPGLGRRRGDERGLGRLRHDELPTACNSVVAITPRRPTGRNWSCATRCRERRCNSPSPAINTSAAPTTRRGTCRRRAGSRPRAGFTATPTALAYFAGKYAGIGTREWALYSGSSSFLTARLCADGTSPTVFNSILSVAATGQW